MTAALNRYGELEAVIDRVAATYNGEHEIDSLESTALPTAAR